MKSFERQKFVAEIDTSSRFHYKKSPYIPLTKTPEIYDYGVSASAHKDLKPIDAEKVETNEISGKKSDESSSKFSRRKRADDVSLLAINETQPAVTVLNLTGTPSDQWKAIPAQSVMIFTKDEQIALPSAPPAAKVDDIKIVHEKPTVANIPHFHVTYWMFYPFSQGKTVCTLNLGPLGPIPIPLVPIFNICLGTKKEFGSHVGDWEHMSLFFRGRMEPDVTVDKINNYEVIS